MDFFESVSPWWWAIITGAALAALIFLFLGIRYEKQVNAKRDAKNWEKRVWNALGRNGYDLQAYMHLDPHREVLVVSGTQTSFWVDVQERSNGSWLYVYDDMGQRHIVQPDDFRRYVDESENWHRRVQREAGFPTQQAS